MISICVDGEDVQVQLALLLLTAVIALGKKIFISLFVMVLSDLYRRPDGSRSNKWLLGWEEFLMMLPALLEVT